MVWWKGSKADPDQPSGAERIYVHRIAEAGERIKAQLRCFADEHCRRIETVASLAAQRIRKEAKDARINRREELRKELVIEKIKAGFAVDTDRLDEVVDWIMGAEPKPADYPPADQSPAQASPA